MATFRGAILDVDGTLVRGNDRIPGAREGVRVLRDAGADLLLCSNNPTRPAEYHADRLTAHGIDVAPGQVLTAATVTAEYLASEHPDGVPFVVGEPYLHDLLREYGFDPTDDPDAADVVVASIDREFDYDRLTRAFWALEDGAAFVGTDPDRTIPTSDRLVPGSGAVVNAIAGVAGREPDRVLGKPSEETAATALERLGVAAERCLVVGDHLDTDVALGERLGMTTALVLSGVTTRADLDDATVRPDHVLDSLAEVGRLLD
ncbi:HAD-IIA family hydrolase [Halomicrococcus sp. SG-WS-1]|uniref:HAD-IIA family hydrolase n=1 Tax=Halomicrococcus sp. SG-WS-1 TaxID=3439057 RepID=UPI003F7AAA04